MGNLHSSGLLPSRTAEKKRTAIYDGRTVIGEEVDVVIGTGSELAPTEVKAGAQPRLADVAPSRAFRLAHGRTKRAAMMIPSGTTLEGLAPDLPAALWRSVL
ncbi:MAG: hypothetical protein KatS3mg125_0320 [Lysobacterales bacterium]|nr:MAG: hypothetical protein KatS3mg125_0320 [Xanthomonadales bacterium]